MAAEQSAPEKKAQVQPEVTLFGAAPAPETQAEERRPLVIFVLAAVFIAVALALWFVGTHGAARRTNNGPPAYAAQLALADLKLSQAQNFIGSNVTYLDGTVTNNGDKTVNAATVEVIFQNSLNEVVQDETQPLRILDRGGAYPQAVDLAIKPVAPHQSREFRLTFEHISADWNQQLPTEKVVDVTTR